MESQLFLLDFETKEKIRTLYSDFLEIKNLILKKGESIPTLGDWITEKEAMQLLGKRKTSLYKLRKDGEIVSTNSRPIFYSKEAIIAYLNSIATKSKQI